MRVPMAARRFLRNPLATGGAVVLLTLAVLAAAAPWVAPYAPDAVAPREMLQGPGPRHLLGTDDLGRDVLSRLLHAGRVSLTLGAGTAVLAAALGVTLGALAGYFGGWIDRMISAVIDTFLSIPVLAVAMVAGALLQVTTGRLVLLLSILSWQSIARVVRGQVLSLKEWPFVEAARAVGASDIRILFRHIVPATLGPALVALTLLVAQAILVESALSFLGFGVRPPAASWGNMLNAGQIYLREAPWLAVFPGLAIMLTVASTNFVGEALRTTLDPRFRGR